MQAVCRPSTFVKILAEVWIQTFMLKVFFFFSLKLAYLPQQGKLIFKIIQNISL